MFLFLFVFLFYFYVFLAVFIFDSNGPWCCLGLWADNSSASFLCSLQFGLGHHSKQPTWEKIMEECGHVIEVVPMTSIHIPFTKTQGHAVCLEQEEMDSVWSWWPLAHILINSILPIANTLLLSL